MGQRKFWVRLSGTPYDSSDRLIDNARHSSRMGCNFLYVTSLPDYNFTNTKVSYDDIFDSSDTSTEGAHPFAINYIADKKSQYSLDKNYLGLYDAVTSTSTGTTGSFYRREYNNYSKKEWDDTTNNYINTHYEFIGPWEPVTINLQSGLFRDFNIKSGHSYQYIMYPGYSSQGQVFAKDKNKQDQYSLTEENFADASTSGDVISVNWQEWSLSELIEEKVTVDTPTVKKIYQVDLDNIWLFKYKLETGSQKQNIVKNQVNTLGQFPRIAHGFQNNISGSITCLLGSEIVPYSGEGYVERMRSSISHPLSTNERAYMLKQWRAFCYSKNPKLLKDNKGQSWIVSVIDNSNTPYTFYHNQPDSISFSWVEIESTDKVVIYGGGSTLDTPGQRLSLWAPTNK